MAIELVQVIGRRTGDSSLVNKVKCALLLLGIGGVLISLSGAMSP